MTTTKTKKEKKSTSGVKIKAPKLLSLKEFAVLALLGGTLGLSAPGIGLWFVAWFGLAPLFLAIASSRGFFHAFLRGLIFGTTFNLVYLNWYLGLYPLEWLGFNWWQGWLLAGAAWTIVSIHQGLIIGIFAALMKLIPTSAGFLPVKSSGKWKLPALIVVPLLWVLLENKIGNMPDLIGVPWSLLEYTQYKETHLIQVASLIGGIGIGFLIAATNCAIATLYATLKKGSTYKSLSAKNKKELVLQTSAMATLLISAVLVGFWQSSQSHVPTTTQASVIQGNVNIEMQKSHRRYTRSELLELNTSLLRNCPQESLALLTESAVPEYLRESPATQDRLSAVAKSRKLDIITGALDRTSRGPHNSAYGITRSGKILSTVYHKRFLVPFGEYAPKIIDYFPQEVRRLTNTPAGSGFAPGNSPETLNLSLGEIAPLICFECISPELVAASTRNGGSLLVNTSDLAWFHNSSIGEQMIAFSVMRAIENRRYFIFAANTGPSAIINPRGKITKRSRLSTRTVMTGRVGFSQAMTPFATWFR